MSQATEEINTEMNQVFLTINDTGKDNKKDENEIDTVRHELHDLEVKEKFAM